MKTYPSTGFSSLRVVLSANWPVTALNIPRITELPFDEFYLGELRLRVMSGDELRGGRKNKAGNKVESTLAPDTKSACLTFLCMVLGLLMSRAVSPSLPTQL